MAIALRLARLGENDRDIHLFDTFMGMTAPGANDIDFRGVRADESYDWTRATRSDVLRNMESTGYPIDRVHLIAGMVEDTIPDNAPEAIALLRLDTDWYESTRHEMTHLYPRLTDGGILIIDDYGHWMGSRKAVDEYIATHRLRLHLARIDYSARIAVKQGQ